MVDKIYLFSPFSSLKNNLLATAMKRFFALKKKKYTLFYFYHLVLQFGIIQ